MFNENDREIEDVIDARKKSGQYNIQDETVTSTSTSCRFVYSTPTSGLTEDRIFNECINEGDYLTDTCYSNVGSTDSEITVVRVKREGLNNKLNNENMWDTMHDVAIPGDGTHLGESPSLINLVTLVSKNVVNFDNVYEGNEYLVPLSSWDPNDKPYTEIPHKRNMKGATAHSYYSTDLQSGTSGSPLTLSEDRATADLNSNDGDIKSVHLKRLSLAEKISNFLRKRRSKKLKTTDGSRATLKSEKSLV